LWGHLQTIIRRTLAPRRPANPKFSWLALSADWADRRGSAAGPATHAASRGIGSRSV
jgi:hypothetical protein